MVHYMCIQLSQVKRMRSAISIIPVHGIGEIPLGADLGALILAALNANQVTLLPHDIVVITQKIVSKAEGRIVDPATLSRHIWRIWPPLKGTKTPIIMK